MTYYEHPTRRYNGRADRRFVLRYRIKGKQYDETVGYASQKWNAVRASNVMSELKDNQRTGKGPKTLNEKRELERAKDEAEKIEKAEQAKAARTFADYFENTYYPIAQTSKKRESYRKEDGHFKNWLNPILGDIPMRDITRHDLERVKDTMVKKGKSARTQQYVLATFRQCWNHAKADGFPPLLF